MTPTERAELIADITAAMQQVVALPILPALTDEEVAYVRLAIKRGAQSIELRRAIIEKTLVGLVWMCVLGLGTLFISWLNQHGLKI